MAMGIMIHAAERVAAAERDILKTRPSKWSQPQALQLQLRKLPVKALPVK